MTRLCHASRPSHRIRKVQDAPFPQLERPADAPGLVLTWSRQGYAGSTDKHGRSVADVVAGTVVSITLAGRDAGRTP